LLMMKRPRVTWPNHVEAKIFTRQIDTFGLLH
jgi:hypothetical protein